MLDVEPDEWYTDIGNYNLYCDLRSFGIPKDENTAKRFVEAARQVDSPMSCSSFNNIMDIGL